MSADRSDKVVSLETVTLRVLRGGRDGGHDGGMPPDDLRERVARIEANTALMAAAVTALGPKIDGLTDKISGLAERISTVEGKIDKMPSLYSVLIGQVAAAAVVAGVIIAAFSFGLNRAAPPSAASTNGQQKSEAPSTPATPAPAKKAGETFENANQPPKPKQDGTL